MNQKQRKGMKMSRKSETIDKLSSLLDNPILQAWDTDPERMSIIFMSAIMQEIAVLFAETVDELSEIKMEIANMNKNAGMEVDNENAH